ncbi:Hypothetical_protein [Hexamita inflata]|uniref:Hypothetical_protein n=1 Tax=Hexamita inflata TaxID=28002 RepID=A0AA86U855_9EUKA|nr:Hypothetical protein HINF_LOCUS29012 [Hexamita inflata]
MNANRHNRGYGNQRSSIFTAYIQIYNDQNFDKNVVLQELAALFQLMALELALNKYSSTQDGCEITFFGSNILPKYNHLFQSGLQQKFIMSQSFVRLPDHKPLKYLILRFVVSQRSIMHRQSTLYPKFPKKVLETNMSC